MNGPLLACLALLSGMGGVAYEVLYLRHLTTLFGDMFYVHAALLTTFLIGMGAGASLAHRFMRRLYAFELATGVYAFCLPALAQAWQASPLARLLPDPGANAVLAAIALLAFPSVCIGFSIPLFSAYLSRQRSGRDAFPVVYGLYNLGAFACVLLVEFASVRLLGISKSLMLIGLINVGCGFALLARRDLWPAGSRETWTASSLLPSDLWGLFLASLASALFQGFYFKVCYHLFRPHRENFALLTGVALLAIALGTLLVRRLKLSFADCLLCAMLSIAAVYAAFSPIAALYGHAAQALAAHAAGTIALKLAAAFLLGGIPLAFLGGTIPALLSKESAVARDSGRLLFVSGLANGLGYFGYVFLAHPHLRLFTTAALAVLLMAIAASMQAGVSFLGRRAFSAALAGLLLIPLYRQPERLVYAANMRYTSAARLTHYKRAADDVTHIVDERLSSVTYNGHPSVFIRQEGGINLAEVGTAVIPALLAPRRDSALVLGMGTGITAGTAARLFRRTDVVEINEAFFDLLPALEDANLELRRNPRALLVHDDARRFLARQGRSYDAIMNSLPTPAYYSAGKLFTSEFLALVKRRLAPGGVYATWFSSGDLPPEGVRIMMATLSGEFEHCGLAVLRKGYYLATCSDRPLSPRRFSELEPPSSLSELLRSALAYAHPDAYFDALLISGDVLPHLPLEGASRNLDDLPALEFHASRPGVPGMREDWVLEEPDRFGVRIELPTETTAFVDKAVVFFMAHPGFFNSVFLPVLKADASLGRAVSRRLLDLYEREEKAPDPDRLLLMATLAIRAGDYGAAVRLAGEALKLDPSDRDAAHLLARAYARLHDEKNRSRWALTRLALGGR